MLEPTNPKYLLFECLGSWYKTTQKLTNQPQDLFEGVFDKAQHSPSKRRNKKNV